MITFYARLDNSNQFKKIIKNLINVFGEMENEILNLECTPMGLTSQVVDHSKICLADFKLESDSFAVYDCNEILKIGIHLKQFNLALNCSDDNCSLEIVVESDSLNRVDTFNVVLGDESNGLICDFDNKTVESEPDYIEIPCRDYATSIRLSTKEFKNIGRHLNLIGTNVFFSVYEQQLHLETEGKLGKGIMKLQPSINKSRIIIESKEPHRKPYNLKFIYNFTKDCPTTLVEIKLSDGLPMMIDFKFSNKSYLRYYLAPRHDK